MGLEEKPFAEWVVRSPIKLHGAGFRSLEDVCYPGFIGSLCQAAPYMAEVEVLKATFGGEEVWGEDGDQASRWAPLLSSGQTDGVELRAAWNALGQEMTEAGLYLGEVLDGSLSAPVEGAGAGVQSIRKSIAEAREATRARLLLRALEMHPNREARAAWSWPSRDKHAAVWLLCHPGPNNGFSSEQFSEAFASMLCQPSPACQDRIGDQVPGRRRVDKWGDEVVNAVMRGDGFRIRHDAVKLELRRLLRWAGIPVICEVFNQFSDCIPQEALNRIERGRQRQGLVPDFKMPGEQGEGDILCEVKCMSASKSRYPRNPRQGAGTSRAVDRRAEGLTADYTRKAKEIDHQHCGVPRPPRPQIGAGQLPPQVGPVQRRLQRFGRVRGWCFGAWGEASEDVHHLVQRLADARLLVADLQPGRRRPQKSKEAERAALVGYIRRQLSFTAVQQQSKLLLDRLQLLGDGVAEAERRRGWAEEVERRAARERQAQAVCIRQGRALMRHGFGKLL